MAKRRSRQQIIDDLASVKNVGEYRAQRLYEDLKVRSLDELVAIAQKGELQQIQGIGAATEKHILTSALSLIASREEASEAEAPAPKAEAPKAEAPKAEAPAPTEAEREVAGEEASEADASQEAPDEVAQPVEEVEESVEEAPVPGAATPLRLQDVLVCPNCGHDAFVEDTAGITCCACRREYVSRRGVVDLAPPYHKTHSLTQRLMESRLYARFYEDVMRPRLTSLVTSRSLREEYALSVELLDLEPGARLLDVACGTGNFTRYFAQRLDAIAEPEHPSLLVGIDVSLPMLEVARQSVLREGLEGRVQLVRGDAARLPFARASFDRVHCAGALHLMDDVDEVLRNFACVLQSDGVLVIGTFVTGSRLSRKLIKRAAEIPTRFHWFDPKKLRQQIERAGFEVVEEHLEGDALTLKARRA